MDKTLYYRTKCIRYGRNIVLVILLLCVFFGCHRDNTEIRVLFVGDILLSRNVKDEFQSKKTLPWENLTTFFKSADLVIGNLEGAVGNAQDQFSSKVESPVFSIDSSAIPMLQRAGFSVITIENNHSFDLGIKGKENAIESLRKNNLNPVCFDNSPQFFTVKDIVISVISLNDVIGRDSSKNEIPSIEVEQKIRLAKSLSSIVIVSIHWGSELLDWPNKRQRELANWLIKKGADIIIGSHPHIVQKPEIIDGKLVFFSLGNHLFDQKYPSTKEGLMADIRIHNGKVSCKGIITHTKPHSFYPVIIDCIDFKFEPIQLRSSPLKVSNYTLKPLSVVEDNKNRIVLQAYQNDKLVWKTFPMSILTVSSCKLDGENEFLFTLQKHYSSIDKEISVRPYVYSLDKRGLVARWRGSALAWPLIDAQISPVDNKTLCALHRGDSFIILNKTIKSKRIAVYKWNGFGFKCTSDTTENEICKKLYQEY